MSNCALLIVDMVDVFLNDFREANIPIGELIDSNEAVLKASIERGYPVATFTYGDDGGGYPLAASEDPRIIDELQVLVDQIPEDMKFQGVKYDESCFSVPELEEKLELWNTRDLVIGGINNKCVYDTVSDGVERGYGITSARDLIDDPLVRGCHAETVRLFKRSDGLYGNHREMLEALG